MTTECYTQLDFSFQKNLVVNFSGGTITSDAGLLLIREMDQKLGLTADVIRSVDDPRDERYIRHALSALLRQRVYQIVGGYEDVNDADRLRQDPTFMAIAGNEREVLGSQPTLSRLENEVSWTSIGRLSQLGVKWFCAHAYPKKYQPEEIVLDVDSTDDPTHGHQQLALFTGYYNQTMYSPLCWFEAHTGLPLKTRLRPGRDQADFVVEDLNQIVPSLKRRFPGSSILFRADSGMCTSMVLDALEDRQIQYVLGMKFNAAYVKRIQAQIEEAQARCQHRGQPVVVYTSFRHQAQRGRKHQQKQGRKAWKHSRRILAKIAVDSMGTRVRFHVTNRPGATKDLIEWYHQRGQASENRIKELKLDIQADRLSCHLFQANAVRLQLHTIALLLLSYFRRHALVHTELADATVGTIRVRLLKVGARIVYTARRIWFHLASYWPGQDLFCFSHQVVVRAST